MRDEEYDWAIYHVITGAKGCTMDEICKSSGLSPHIIQKSLDRLRSHLLIVCHGDRFRACSIEEYMITSQMKHDPCSNIIIENGVVKVRGAPPKIPERDGEET